MKASELFRYCPTCRQEIPLTKCKTQDWQCESYIPKATIKPYCGYDINEYKKKAYTLTRYMCPNDDTVIEERIQ